MDFTPTQKNLLVLGAVIAGILWLSKRGNRREEAPAPRVGVTDFEKRVEGMRRSFNEDELEPAVERETERDTEREYETDAETGELTGRWRPA